MSQRINALALAITLLVLGACASAPELKRKMASTKGGANLSSSYGIK